MRLKEAAPFRFVILCDSLDFPKWQADCLREVIEPGLAVPVGLVINASSRISRGQSDWRSRWRNRRHAMWRVFNRFYVDAFCKATVREGMEDYFRSVPQFRDHPLKVGRFGEALSDAAVGFVKDLAPHFVLRFGFGILKGEILKAAPFGVWSYHHGDPSNFRGQPPGFWEIYSGSDVTGSILQLLSEELDAGTVLHSGFFKTTHQSYAKTKDAIYFGSSSWVRRACAAIQENGWPLRTSVNAGRGPIWKLPDNMQMIRFCVRTALSFLRVQWTYRLFFQDWTCAVVPAPIHTVAGLKGLDAQTKALGKTQWMTCPPDHFVADPFGYPVGSGSKIRMVFELFDKRKKIGVIASTCFFEGSFSGINLVLDSPAHLSYPYVMRDGENVYFIPEHAGARNISAFRLNQAGAADQMVTIFPHSELLDPTLFRWNGKWWLFVLDESRSKNTDLHVYFAETWQGPWRAHPLNPVKTDIRSSRPAGTPFVHEGKLYRPSQDCSTHYGSATVINEVIALSENVFEERPVARVQPWRGSKYQYGLHTLSEAGAFTLIDGAKQNSIFIRPWPGSWPRQATHL